MSFSDAGGNMDSNGKDRLFSPLVAFSILQNKQIRAANWLFPPAESTYADEEPKLPKVQTQNTWKETGNHGVTKVRNGFKSNPRYLCRSQENSQKVTYVEDEK